jgi:hypothetical protein
MQGLWGRLALVELAAKWRSWGLPQRPPDRCAKSWWVGDRAKLGDAPVPMKCPPPKSDLLKVLLCHKAVMASPGDLHVEF